MANLHNIVYLSEAQKNTLFTTGTVTVGGVTVSYNDDDIYLTPDGAPELPVVTSSDEGKALVVDNNGDWVAGNVQIPSNGFEIIFYSDTSGATGNKTYSELNDAIANNKEVTIKIVTSTAITVRKCSKVATEILGNDTYVHVEAFDVVGDSTAASFLVYKVMGISTNTNTVTLSKTYLNFIP